MSPTSSESLSAWYRRRPRVALWIKRQCVFLTYLPFIRYVWTWADNRVDRWHQEPH